MFVRLCKQTRMLSKTLRSSSVSNKLRELRCKKLSTGIVIKMPAARWRKWQTASGIAVSKAGTRNTNRKSKIMREEITPLGHQKLARSLRSMYRYLRVNPYQIAFAEVREKIEVDELMDVL